MRVCEFISQRAQQANLSDEIIANATGVQAKVVAMIKVGDCKIPLAQIPAFATALGVDPKELFKVVIGEYQPELLSVIDQIYGA